MLKRRGKEELEAEEEEEEVSGRVEACRGLRGERKACQEVPVWRVQTHTSLLLWSQLSLTQPAILTFKQLC